MLFKIFKIINIKIFIISLLIGLYYIYYIDDKKEITTYPTLHNNVLYRDKAQNCFKYSFTETKCPNNKNDIKTIPEQ